VQAGTRGDSVAAVQRERDAIRGYAFVDKRHDRYARLVRGGAQHPESAQLDSALVKAPRKHALVKANLPCVFGEEPNRRAQAQDTRRVGSARLVPVRAYRGLVGILAAATACTARNELSRLTQR
jgi:hypothetical protein